MATSQDLRVLITKINDNTNPAPITAHPPLTTVHATTARTSPVPDIKKNTYLVTDAIAKAILIDGLSTAEILLMPIAVAAVVATFPALAMAGGAIVGYVPILGAALPILGAAFPVLTAAQIAQFTLTATLAAEVSYFFRDVARKIEHENIGGYSGNLAKYAIKGKPMTINLLVGGPNGLLYEICKTNKECNTDVTTNVIATLAIETADEIAQACLRTHLLGAVITGAVLGEGVVTGVVGSTVLSFNAHVVYGNAIPYIHTVVDTAYDYYETLLGNIATHEEL